MAIRVLNKLTHKHMYVQGITGDDTLSGARQTQLTVLNR